MPKPSAFDLLRPATEPLYTGAVYRVTLQYVPDDEPLKGTSYIGQVVRIGSVGKAVHNRWQSEVSQAAREKHQDGFLAALELFGAEAFHWEILETKKAPRIVARKWANYREVELISQHGGTLRDMMPGKPLRQTFNLQPGGQGKDCFVHMDAFVARRWNVFQTKMSEYVAEHKTAWVPFSYIDASGYKLGSHVMNVRKGQLWKGRPDERERVDWLEALPGWTWSGYAAPEHKKFLSQTAKKNWETGAWKTLTGEAKDRAIRKAVATRLEKRAKKQCSLTGVAKKKHEMRTATSDRYSSKRKRDMAALRATIHPDARWEDLPKYRADGSVTKALRLVGSSD